MPIQAVRGWSLGSVYTRTQVKEAPELECTCTFSEPYLHSPVMGHIHWDGPVVRNTEQFLQVAGRVRPVSALAERPSTRDYSDEAFFYSKGHRDWMAYRFGGFYSYKPEFADRMGKWEEIDVLGVITVFAEVAHHKMGYRSNGVRIDRLWVMSQTAMRFNPKKLEAHLEDVYQCDVTLLRAGAERSFKDWMRREDVSNLLNAPGG